MAGGVIGNMTFKNLKVYWSSLNALNKFGNYTISFEGLSDEDKAFIAKSCKKLKKDKRTGEDQLTFTIKPERIDSLVLVDSRNKKMARQTNIYNGSIANVAVTLYQNAMGTYLLLKGIQIVQLSNGKVNDDYFTDLGGPEEDESAAPWSEGEVDG